MKPLDSAPLVILDCDGVLFDSFDANVAFYDAILSRIGLTPLDEEGREYAHRLATPQRARRAEANVAIFVVAHLRQPSRQRRSRRTIGTARALARELLHFGKAESAHEGSLRGLRRSTRT